MCEKLSKAYGTLSDIIVGIGKEKQTNEPTGMSRRIAKLWAIYKTFGPLG